MANICFWHDYTRRPFGYHTFTQTSNEKYEAGDNWALTILLHLCQLHKAQKADEEQMVGLAVCRETEYCPLHNEWEEPFNSPFGTESRIPNIIVSEGSIL